MLELAVLGLPKAQDLHGYELKKWLSALLGTETTVSFGSLYPALAKLETTGAVEVVTPTSDTASHPNAVPGVVTGRRRKVYRITTSGSDLFEQLIAGGPGTTEDERSFSVHAAGLGVEVPRGPTSDGSGKYYREWQPNPRLIQSTCPKCSDMPAPTCSSRTSQLVPRRLRSTTHRRVSMPAPAS